jgi:hypothetical protein
LEAVLARVEPVEGEAEPSAHRARNPGSQHYGSSGRPLGMFCVSTIRPPIQPQGEAKASKQPLASASSAASTDELSISVRFPPKGTTNCVGDNPQRAPRQAQAGR